MPTLSFNHLALSVKDVAAAVEFYQSVLGLEEIENTASNSKTRWLSLGGGQQLHLIPRPDEKIKITKAVHFALSTNELAAIVKHLVNLNIAYYDWPGIPNKIYVRKDGHKQIYFQDLDGYWIEINDVI